MAPEKNEIISDARKFAKGFPRETLFDQTNLLRLAFLILLDLNEL